MWRMKDKSNFMTIHIKIVCFFKFHMSETKSTIGHEGTTIVINGWYLRHLRSTSGNSSKFDVSSMLLTSTGMAAGLSL